MSSVKYDTKRLLENYLSARQAIREAWLNMRMLYLHPFGEEEYRIHDLSHDLKTKTIEEMIAEIEENQNE